MMQAAKFPLAGGGCTSNKPASVFFAGMASDYAISLTVTQQPRTVSEGSSSTVADHDAYVTTATGSVVDTDYAVAGIPNQYARMKPAVTVSSSDTSILTNPVNGVCTYVSDGVVNILATNGHITDSVQVTTSSLGGQTTTKITGYVPGTLTKYIRDTLAGIVTTVGSSPDLRMFTDYTGDFSTETSFTRNPSLWLPTVDLTGMGVSNSGFDGRFPGTMISPRHFLTAAHAYLPTGCQVKFVDNSNAVVTRTVANVLLDPDYSPFYPDISVGILDEPLPSGYTYYRFLPDNWQDYAYYMLNCPVVGTNQFRQLSIRGWGSPPPSGIFTGKIVYQPIADTSIYDSYFTECITGDSSSPTFLLINGELVLITTYTSPGAGSGTFLQSHKPTINSLMSTLSTSVGDTNNYQVQSIDLSGFITV